MSYSCRKAQKPFSQKLKLTQSMQILTLAELHVCVLRSFIEFIKLLQNFMKLLPNHFIV